MKKTLLTIFLAAAGGYAALAQTADTLTVKNPTIVHVITTDNTQTVVIKGAKGNPAYEYSATASAEGYNTVSSASRIDFDFPFIKKKPAPRARYISGMNCGLILEAGLMEMLSAPKQIGPSWNAGVGVIGYTYYLFNSPVAINLGAGYKLSNYMATGKEHFVWEDLSLGFKAYDSVQPRHSSLQVSSIAIPLTIGIDTGLHSRKFQLMAGPELDINTGARLTTRYIEDGKHKKQNTRHVNVNLTTLSYVATLRMGNIGIYGRYSPSSVMSAEYGPEITSWTAGVQIYFD